MIRSSKVALKFGNTGKQSSVAKFVDEYKRVLTLFVNMLWDIEEIPSLLSMEYTSNIDTWLTARAIQCCGKQASGIVRGVRTKQRRRLFIIKKLNKEKKFKQARKLQAIYNKNLVTKPKIDRIECELDSRFVKINLNKENSFDGWITLASFGKKIKLQIPFRRHKHLNRILAEGKIKSGLRIFKDVATFMFDMPEPIVRTEGKVLGIDVGQKTTLSCSDGQQIDRDKHGHTYQSICKKLTRKKKDSVGFKRADKHRTNYLHWCINKLELNGVRRVNLERIKHLRRGKRSSRVMQHWNYAELFDVLGNKLSERGVLVHKVDPTYTSQRCSDCGWVRKGNRKKKQFKCGKCGHTQDADLNASRNISLELSPITTEQRLLHKNRIGFYWLEVGQEPIVPDAQKTCKDKMPCKR